MAMSEDRMHERLGTYGQRWREQQPVPVPGGLGAARRTSPRRRAALAAAAAVAVIAGVTWAVHLSMDQTPATPGSPTPTLSPSSPPDSASPSPRPSPSTSPTSATAAPACLGSQLSASIGLAGPAAGEETIVVVLHNTSTRPCYLAGLLPLTGVRSDGTVVDLGFRRTSGVGAPITPVTGGGTVAPGGQGAFAVSEGLNNCPKLGSFAKLRIALGAQGHVDMVWPAEFSVGCPSYQGPAGPIPDGPVHL